MRSILSVTVFLALSFAVVSCAPTSTKPGQKQENKNGEIPSPESKEGCLSFVGRYASAKPERFDHVIFGRVNARLSVQIAKGDLKFDLIVGQDPIELQDGTTLVASCNGNVLSVGVVSPEDSLFLKFKPFAETILEVHEFDGEGREVGVWKASKAN